MQQQQRGHSREDGSTGGSSDLSDGWHSGGHVRSADVSSENAEEHDDRLSNLEDRIRTWLRKDNPRVGPKVAQLRRLTVQVKWCGGGGGGLILQGKWCGGGGGGGGV